MDVNRLIDIFVSNGFIHTATTRKVTEYQHCNSEEYVYLVSKTSSAQIVLNPDSDWGLLESKYNLHSTKYHNSNLSRFPKRRNKGKDDIHYGSAYIISDNDILNNVLADISRGFLNKKSSSIERKTSLSEDIREIENRGTISSTMKESLISCRLGQGVFRQKLIDLWKKCSVTGCLDINTLIASHIKPWKDSSDEERLDEFNGLLLTPNLDKLFDLGLITFDNHGKLIISKTLSLETRRILNITGNERLTNLFTENIKYLNYHAQYIFMWPTQC